MTWKEILEPIKRSDEYIQLWKKVEEEYATQECFPPKEKIFRALDLTPFDEVKVVVLGQDPYHDDFQANGLSFSVSDKVKTPPSLRNIYKELKSDLGIDKETNELDSWARQGVLLLNSTLTVKAHQANSHHKLGWQNFTDVIMKEISDKKEHVVFVLWGGFAQKKEGLIDLNKHTVIKSPHPSPLSAYRGFFGSKPFSKINRFLLQQGECEIHW